ncbi:hypothetical protein [Thalassotalea fusca]
MLKNSLRLIIVVPFISFFISVQAFATLVVEKWSMDVADVRGDYFLYSAGDSIEFNVKYQEVGPIREDYFSDTSLPLCTDPAVIPNLNCNRTYEGLVQYFYSTDIEFSFPDFIDIPRLTADGGNVDFGAKGMVHSSIYGEGHRRLLSWVFEEYFAIEFYSSLFGLSGGYESNVDIFTWRYSLANNMNDFEVGEANLINVRLLSRQAIKVTEPPIVILLLISIITFAIRLHGLSNIRINGQFAREK